MDYQKKYVKYKTKYLELKRQIGGDKEECKSMPDLAACKMRKDCLWNNDTGFCNNKTVEEPEVKTVVDDDSLLNDVETKAYESSFFVSNITANECKNKYKDKKYYVPQMTEQEKKKKEKQIVDEMFKCIISENNYTGCRINKKKDHFTCEKNDCTKQNKSSCTIYKNCELSMSEKKCIFSKKG
jgi:hypothetical protein